MKSHGIKRNKQGKQYVLVVIKPDGMSKALVGPILEKFFATKLELIAARVLEVSRKLAEEHYRHIKGQPFYEQTLGVMQGKFYKQKRVLALILCGPDAIRKCRIVAGATNPKEADPRSVRGTFGRVTRDGIYENVVHASSDPKEAEREIKLWFSPDQFDTKIFPIKKSANGRQHKMVWA